MAVNAESAVQLPGPWTHRTVSANGTRFHIAEAGDGPLVLMLHGFPEFWWTWRQQLTWLPGAGFRAVAVDLRGYGGSDKPPRGYDLITAAADAAGLIRALGEANAVVVGHGWGGLVAWTLGVFHPKVAGRVAGGGARRVGELLESWAAPGWPDPETERVYARAMQIPSVAHSALEYHRWLARSALRPDGLRYARRMRTPIQVPTLHLHGALDSCVLPRTARGAGRYVDGPYRWRLIDGAGHFPHEERPEAFDIELRGWLADPEPER